MHHNRVEKFVKLPPADSFNNKLCWMLRGTLIGSFSPHYLSRAHFDTQAQIE